jgi:predicted dehydrogenase
VRETSETSSKSLLLVKQLLKHLAVALHWDKLLNLGFVAPAKNKDNNMIRVGIIGCGSIAGSHRATVKALGERMVFAAFADVELERAKEAAELFPGAMAASDYRDILPHVDAVVVAVPHDLHYGIGMDALAAGKHILMEKPLALTERECLELVAADTSPDPVLMLGYVMRHDPLWNQMGEYIREERFGKVFHVSIWTEQYTDATTRKWLGEAARIGGGQLFSHGCHYIDLLLHWLGDPVCGTHIGTNLCTPWMEREGTSNVSLKFASGATAYHFGTWGARGSKLRYSVHAHTEQGLLELDRLTNTIKLYRNRAGGDLAADGALATLGDTEVTIDRQAGGGKHMVEQMSVFLDCIEQRKKPEISAAASLRSLRVIWRLYEAEDKMLVADLSDI